ISTASTPAADLGDVCRAISEGRRSPLSATTSRTARSDPSRYPPPLPGTIRGPGAPRYAHGLDPHRLTERVRSASHEETDMLTRMSFAFAAGLATVLAAFLHPQPAMAQCQSGSQRMGSARLSSSIISMPQSTQLTLSRRQQTALLTAVQQQQLAAQMALLQQ